MVGRLAWDFTWPEDLERDRIEHGRLLRGEIAVYIREKRYLRRDGGPIWGRASGMIVPALDGRREGMMVSVIEDIDERYKARMALEENTRALELVVGERTAALRQRDLLLRETYHRVKNNLQLIDSFLVLQRRVLKDPQAKDALQSLRGRVHALGLVHHQLMTSKDLATFDIAPFLRELVDNILESGATTGINLSVTATPMVAGLDLAIPLGLLVTELVTNAVKHAFPSGKGNIKVSFTHEDSDILLVVSDDGSGMIGTKAASSSGTGLGTSILAGLVHQLEGSMTMRDEHGVTVEVRIKKRVVS
jgi:two-component sensor histidine kinase